MATDPFAEPGDTEGTVFRPRPSGTGGGPSASGPIASGVGGVAVVERRQDTVRPVPKVGDNALVAAAAPVLAAAVRIANDRAQPPDPERLRRAMTTAIRQFETDALATGLDTRSLRAARYALCATVDDLVLSTPWGMPVELGPSTALPAFSTTKSSGGERFYDILDQMQADLGHHAPVVELMYLCTVAGLRGPLPCPAARHRGVGGAARRRLPHAPPAASATSSASCPRIGAACRRRRRGQFVNATFQSGPALLATLAVAGADSLHGCSAFSWPAPQRCRPSPSFRRCRRRTRCPVAHVAAGPHACRPMLRPSGVQRCRRRPQFSQRLRQFLAPGDHATGW